MLHCNVSKKNVSIESSCLCPANRIENRLLFLLAQRCSFAVFSASTTTRGILLERNLQKGKRSRQRMATDAAGERGGDARDRARRWAAVSQAEGQRFPSSSKWKVTDALGASVSSFVKSGAGADGGGRGMPDSGLRGKRNELPH